MHVISFWGEKYTACVIRCRTTHFNVIFYMQDQDMKSSISLGKEDDDVR